MHIKRNIIFPLALPSSVQKLTDEIQSLNNVPFTQEPLAQLYHM